VSSRHLSGETSGSTGRPITYLVSQAEAVYWHAFTLRDHLWHGRDLGAKLGAIRYAEKNGAGRGWGPSVNLITPSGPAQLLKISTPIDEQVAWLLRVQPDYLLSYPSNLEALVRECLRRGVRWPALREVRSVAENVRPELRALVRAAWDVKLVDVYSTTESGYLALQCPLHDHYHVQEESARIEILDDAGKPCAPGESGRVVVTTLHKFAMPLIRYDLGDYAVPGHPCDCGRGLAVIERILGRTRNLLRLPDGTRRWPLCELIEQPDVPGILQYQFLQKSLGHIEVHLVVGPKYSRSMEARLTEIIHGRLGHSFELAYVYRDGIPRSAGGKFEDFRCEIVEA
jgi:phenylacetate-CoA ligase